MSQSELIKAYLNNGGTITQCPDRGSKHPKLCRKGGSRYSTSPNKR